jgi:uncharacterized spore protein YtfJ
VNENDMSEHQAEARESGRVAERLAELVGGSAGASRVFGAAVERDSITVVPVARAVWGFGGGGGKNDEGSTGSGGGGGARVRPIGFIEIVGDHARFRRIVDPATVAAVLVTALAFGLILLRRWRQ